MVASGDRMSWQMTDPEDTKKSSRKRQQPQQGRWEKAEAPFVSIHLHIVLKRWALENVSSEETYWKGKTRYKASGERGAAASG